MKTQRSISEIANEIRRSWNNISPYAKPYLDAMRSIDSIDSDYGQDSAKSIVMYFLANAGGWRGDDAKRIKAELKAL